MKKALLVVDAQYDFMPGGALPVSGGNEIIPLILKMRPKFDTVVFTQDWHPADHCSFKTKGGPWPEHCIQNTDGARIVEGLLQPSDLIVQKGTHQDVDSYSGFWDTNKAHQTELDSILRQKGIDTVFICGLATDYCVKFTALHAVEAGYNVQLIVRACRGVNVSPGDVDKALKEIEEAGKTGPGTVRINYRYGKTKGQRKA
jgi:nicotinamidase/pyrazinamidase